MNITLDIDPQALAESFCDSCDQSEAFDFITRLDVAMADNEFTLHLAKHLVKELIGEAKAAGESFDLQELLE